MIWMRNESRTPSFHCEVSDARCGEEWTCLGEDVGDLALVEAETALEDVVGLGDELHVTVLDTVVDHLDVVSGA